jgi:hypothetical protein
MTILIYTSTRFSGLIGNMKSSFMQKKEERLAFTMLYGGDKFIERRCKVFHKRKVNRFMVYNRWDAMILLKLFTTSLLMATAWGNAG